MLRDYQKKGEDDIYKAWETYRRVMYQLPTGGGKCLGKDTPVLMYDGTIKLVQDVATGDVLIGPDSNPRRVLSTTTGREELFRITPIKGDSWVCNGSHILSLKRTKVKSKPLYPCQKEKTINVSVKNYLQSSQTFRHEFKQWRTAIDFARPFGDELLEAYYVGLWLGDGDSNAPKITTGDTEVKEYLRRFAFIHGLRVRAEFNSKWSENYHLVGSKGKINHIRSHLKTLDLMNNKHVPNVFKLSNRNTRLELLAGLMDSDGSYTGKGYDLCLKSERLIDDVIFICRSLGFSAYKSPTKKKCHNNGVIGDYFRCTISGNVDQIPCLVARKKAKRRIQKKSVLVTGFKIESIGVGDYYGFEISGDRLFLLGDFTVTHNTINVTNISRNAFANGARVVFMAHREELISQAWQTFYRHELNAGIIKADVKPNYSLPIQIASVQTLARRAKLPPADYVIIDEAHHAMDDNSYGKVIKEHWPNAFVLGVTATPYRLNGKGFKAMFDTLVETVQIKDLVDEGWLVPIRYFVAYNPDLSHIKVEKGDYNIEEAALVMGHAPLVKSYLEHCQGKSGMVFAVNVGHSNKIVNDYLDAGIPAAHIDANTPDPLRRKLFTDFKEKKILVLSNVGIATEGVDVPNMDFVQLARPTKSLSLFLQMVGRGTRVDNELIKGILSADERRLLISTSKKPHCIILDNAGLFREHGLPDEPQNWQTHFRGWSKKKKNEVKDFIEIIEFVAEDESGRRVRSTTPEEVEGLKLIEINKSIKQKVVDYSCLKELDEGFRLAKYIKAEDGSPRIKKIGFFAFEKFMTHCRKKGLLVSDEIWEILFRRLYHDPQEKEVAELNLFNSVVESLRDQFNKDESDALELVAKDFVDKKIAEIKAYSLPKTFLTKERKDYFDRINNKTPNE